MEKILKRLLSFAIALFMVLGMVPASAFDVFAADDKGYMLTIYNEDGTENMTIDGTKSASEFNVASALEDAYTFGDNAFLFGITGTPTYELQLLQDVEMTEMFAIAAGKNVVIDLNGHAITSGYQLLENASSGRPIITTNNAGCKETVQHNITGYIYNGGNVDELVKKIELFLSIENKDRELMGKRGRKRMEKYFSRQVVIDVYLEKIKTLI